MNERTEAQDRPEVIEVEAEPLPDPDAEADGLEQEVARRVFDTFGPIVAAMVIDGVDLATFGPLAYVAGFPAGSIAGWALAGWLGYSTRARLLIGVLCGAYCTIPITSPIPVATVIAVTANMFIRR